MPSLSIFPKCPNCEKGVLLPFQDVTKLNELTFWKAWACSSCETEIVYKNGQFERTNSQNKWK